MNIGLNISQTRFLIEHGILWHKLNSSHVLKELAPSITPWLSPVFQQSYDTEAVPSDWTKTLV